MATLAISVLGTVFIVGFLVYTGEPVPLDPLLFCFRNLSLVSRPHVFDGFGCQLAYSLSKHAEGSTSKWGHPQNSSFMGKLHRKTSAFFSSVFRKENENINTSVQAAQEYPSPVEPKDGDRPKNPMPVVVHRRAVHYLTNTGTAHGKNPENPLSPMQGNAARLTSSARNDSPTYDLAGALKHFDMDAPGTAKGEFKTTKIFSADTRPPPGFIARAMARAASRAAAGGLYRDTSFPNMQSTGRSSSSDSEETVREGKGKETQRDSKDTNVSKGSTATEGFSQTKLDELRAELGCPVVREDMDESLPRHTNHGRGWYAINLQCHKCAGRCVLCGDFCCRFQEFLNLYEYGNLPELNELEAADYIERIVNLGTIGLDISTFSKCTTCFRLACPHCCGICPDTLMCKDLQCSICKPDPWTICDWHADM